MLELWAGHALQLCSPENFGYLELTRSIEEDDLLSNAALVKALNAAEQPGTHVIVSLPCTGGTTWTYVNEKIPGADQKVEEGRTKFSSTSY